MAYKSYRMLADSKIEPKAVAGTVVYDIKGYDYGLARDDTYFTGKKHISVTMNQDGDYPSFTVPVDAIEELSSPSLPSTDSHKASSDE